MEHKKTLAKKAHTLFSFPVKHIKIFDNIYKIQKFLRWSWASLTRTKIYSTLLFGCRQPLGTPQHYFIRELKVELTNWWSNDQLVILNWGLVLLAFGIGDLNPQFQILKTPIPNDKSPIGNFITIWWFPLLVFCLVLLTLYILVCYQT